MYTFLEHYGRFVSAGLYMAGFYPMFFRWQGYLVAYLRHFPPVNGVPLDRHHGGNGHNPFGPFARAVQNAKGKRQADPELERMRQEVRWRYGQFLLWAVGFPVLCLVVADAVLPLLPH